MTAVWNIIGPALLGFGWGYLWGYLRGRRRRDTE